MDHLENFVDNIFSNQLQRFINRNEEKIKNKVTCSALTDDYVNNYCEMCSYNPTTGIYFKQDGKHFTYTNEDSITYDILMTLQKMYPTMNTTNKINVKRNVLKRIKNNSYDEIIPESATIQYIIKFLTPIIFESREQSKYFLTFIGDLILRKNRPENEKCFIVNCDNNFRAFLYQINKYINLFIYNMNILNSIKLRFYHHDTRNANLLYLNHNIDYSYFNKDTSFFITFIFICIYHSNKYENASKYLLQYNDSEEIEYIKSLRDLNKETFLIIFGKLPYLKRRIKVERKYNLVHLEKISSKTKITNIFNLSPDCN